MKYERFEDLPVWKAAAELAVQIFAWSSHAWFRGKGDLANQLQRAALSVSNNIEEGFERGSNNELLQFIYIARGSAGEVRSMLCVIERMDVPENLRSQISNLKLSAEGISRQLRGWANSLQNRDIAGQRHLNDQSKQTFDNKAKADRFVEQVRRTAEEAQAERARKAASTERAEEFAAGSRAIGPAAERQVLLSLRRDVCFCCCSHFKSQISNLKSSAEGILCQQHSQPQLRNLNTIRHIPARSCRSKV